MTTLNEQGRGMGISIVGVGETASARRLPQRADQLALEAILAALDDAGIHPSEVDGVMTEATVMPRLVGPDLIVANLGLDAETFTACVGVGGSGTSATPRLAAAAIAAGLARVVVCYFVSKFGSNPAGPYSWHSADPVKRAVEMPLGFFPQPVYFGPMMARYMHEYGVDREDFGKVAQSARTWAARHPRSLNPRSLSTEEYAESPLIADPVRIADCCLVNDVAGAFVMVADDRAADTRHAPISVLGCAMSTAPVTSYSAFAQRCIQSEGVRSGASALRQAGLSAQDVDVIEVYDCFTISAIIQLEDLGFAAPGEGLGLFTEGHALPGGRLPVNTHGGLLANSYAGGIGHVVEAVEQVRGTAGARQVPDARVAAVTGYSPWEHSTLILGLQ